MTYIALYLLIGVIACILDVSLSAKKGKDAPSVYVLFEPIMIIAWPLLLIISCIEKKRPDIKPMPTLPAKPLNDYLNQSGTVVVELRPTGKIQIQGSIFDARAKFELIPVGSNVQVVGRELGEFLVEKI